MKRETTKMLASGILGAILSGSVALAAVYTAEPASFKVLVNGQEFTSDPPAMVINGSTYLPLRAMEMWCSMRAALRITRLLTR